MLLFDAKRAFSAKWFYLSIIFMILFSALSRLDTITEVIRSGDLLESGWTTTFITETLTGEAMLFCLPVLCTLPFAAAFIDEYKSGITRFAITRVSRKVWLRSKAVTAALSGGCLLLSGALAVSLAAAVIFSPAEASAQIASEMESGALTTILPLMIRYFCFGSLGAVTGMYISTAVNNRFMAWLSPFMAEYLLIILCERYVDDIAILYPAQWLSPSDAWPFHGYGPCLWMALLTLFVSAAFIKTAERRLDNV